MVQAVGPCPCWGVLVIVCHLTCCSLGSYVWQAACSAQARSFAHLQAVLPPDILLPSRRLQILVEQAMELQLMRCRYHNQPVPVFSLLSDYSCGPEQIPSVTTQVGWLGACALLQ